MLYQTYQLQDDLVAPLRLLAPAPCRRVRAAPFCGFRRRSGRQLAAALEMISRFELTHARPGFRHRDGAGRQPRRAGDRARSRSTCPSASCCISPRTSTRRSRSVLVVAPLSGHFATLLRGTVETLLRDHDVYITDWANARDVPVAAGRFGVEDYVDYLIRFLEEIGPGAHILAVCQPCVQALAAVAVMSRGHATRRRRAR